MPRDMWLATGDSITISGRHLERFSRRECVFLRREGSILKSMMYSGGLLRDARLWARDARMWAHAASLSGLWDISYLC